MGKGDVVSGVNSSRCRWLSKTFGTSSFRHGTFASPVVSFDTLGWQGCLSLASNTPQTPQILWTFPMFTGIILLDIWETYTFNFQQSFFSYEWGPNCFWTNDPISISPTPRDVPFTTDVASDKGKHLTASKATKLQGCLLIKTLQMPTHLSSDGNSLPTSFDHTHQTRAMWNRKKKIFGGMWAKAAHHMKVCKTKPSPK